MAVHVTKSDTNTHPHPHRQTGNNNGGPTAPYSRAGAWCKLGTNRLTNPSLPYPTLKTDKMVPHLYRGMPERRTIAPISEVIPAFAAVVGAVQVASSCSMLYVIAETFCRSTHTPIASKRLVW